MSFGGVRDDEFELFDALVILPLFLQALGDVVEADVVSAKGRGGRLRGEAFGCSEGVMVHIGLDMPLQLLEVEVDESLLHIFAWTRIGGLDGVVEALLSKDETEHWLFA